jgi:hypothetical protein
MLTKQGPNSPQLFPTAIQWDADGGDYQKLMLGFVTTTAEKKYMAELWPEKLAMDNLRLARITRDEQLLFASSILLDGPRVDRIVLNRNSVEKAIYRETSR